MWLVTSILNNKALAIPDKTVEGESQLADQLQPIIFYKIWTPYRQLCEKDNGRKCLELPSAFAGAIHHHSASRGRQLSGIHSFMVRVPYSILAV